MSATEAARSPAREEAARTVPPALGTIFVVGAGEGQPFAGRWGELCHGRDAEKAVHSAFSAGSAGLRRAVREAVSLYIGKDERQTWVSMSRADAVVVILNGVGAMARPDALRSKQTR